MTRTEVNPWEGRCAPSAVVYELMQTQNGWRWLLNAGLPSSPEIFPRGPFTDAKLSKRS
jgi:hypothetical protein